MWVGYYIINKVCNRQGVGEKGRLRDLIFFYLKNYFCLNTLTNILFALLYHIKYFLEITLFLTSIQIKRDFIYECFIYLFLNRRFMSVKHWKGEILFTPQEFLYTPH